MTTNDDCPFKLEYVFDADAATVQRSKSEIGVTARDILTMEMVENAYLLSALYAQSYWSDQPQ